MITSAESEFLTPLVISSIKRMALWPISYSTHIQRGLTLAKTAHWSIFKHVTADSCNLKHSIWVRKWKQKRSKSCSDLVWYKLCYCHLEKDKPHQQLHKAETHYSKTLLKNNQLARCQWHIPDFDFLCSQSIIKYWTILKETVLYLCIWTPSVLLGVIWPSWILNLFTTCFKWKYVI